MTQFGFQPRMEGSPFFERTRPIAKVRIPPPRSPLLRAVETAVEMNCPRLDNLCAIEAVLNATNPMEPLQPTMQDIKRSIAGKYGMTIVELVSRRRLRRSVLARQEAYYECWRLTGHSHSEIGRAFDNRDPTTIMHGIARHKARLAKAHHDD